MKIKINDKYFIEVEDKQFTLKANVSIDKSGRERSEIKGYFGKLEYCLEYLLKLFIVDKCKKDIITLQEFRDIILESQKEIKSICQELKI